MNETSNSFAGILPSMEAVMIALPTLGGLALAVLLCIGLFIAGRRKGQSETARAAMSMSNRQYRKLKRDSR